MTKIIKKICTVTFCHSNTGRRNSRVGAVSLRVDRSQVVALSNKDVKLAELLNVVDGKLDVALDLHEVAAVHGHHASTQLRAQKEQMFSTALMGAVALWEKEGSDMKDECNTVTKSGVLEQENKALKDPGSDL